ncbi:MAG: hypothetical protein HQ564_10015 [Candidatus Saganbacteria bacterium]|nr:hypothetical protein [Candidatus Saganbacteria bacterium]
MIKRHKNPIIIFDMAFREKGDPRSPCAVTLAAMSLTQVLLKKMRVRPLFMPRPLIYGGTIKLPQNKKKPLIFAVSLSDVLFEQVQKEVKAIRSAYPDACIIIGGPGVNTCNDLKPLAAFFKDANALVKGDGELVIVDLIKAILSCPVDEEKIKKLKGIYFQHGRAIYCNNEANVLTEKQLNNLPYIYPFPGLKKDIKKEGVLPISASRGCKYRCVFCSHKYHPCPIYLSARRLVRELINIEALISSNKLPKEASSIGFIDDDFFQDRGRTIRFLSKVSKAASLKNKFSFSFQGTIGSFFKGKRKKNLDTKLLNLLAEINTRNLFLGTDGFHPQTLKYLRKGGYSFEMALNLMRELDQRNIIQYHFVILTYPTMSRGVLKETIKNLIQTLGKFKRTVVFSIKLSLKAFAETPLIDSLEGSPEGRLLSADGNAIKRLPFDLTIEDPALRRDCRRILSIKPRGERMTIGRMLIGYNAKDQKTALSLFLSLL